MAPTAEITVEVFGRTDIGLVREHNEDNYLVADLTRHERSLKPEARQYTLAEGGALFVVCDGMGGAVCGEVASQMAIDTVYELMQGGAPGATRDVFSRRLRGAVQEANRRIFAYERADHSRSGMGTTCTAAGLVDGTLVLAQIGDSRGYLLRGGKMAQVTRDQSLANQLIEAGQMTPEEAREFEHANIILQALGVMDRVDVVLTEVPLRRGDVIMLCSDGLSGPVQDADIQVLLAGAPDPMEACRRLTEASRTNGAPDNITVVVARFGGAGLPESTESDVVRYQPHNPGPGEGDEVDTGLAAAERAAAAEAAVAAQFVPAEPTGKLDAAGSLARPTSAGFQVVGGTPAAGAPAGGPPASAPGSGEAANPGAALAATAAAFGPTGSPSGTHLRAGPASGLTMVPGAMMGYVPFAPPAAAPAAAAGPPVAALAAPAAPAGPGPVTLYGAPPVAASDEDYEIPRRRIPVVPILVFVLLVTVLIGVGGYWLLRHASKEGEVARGAPTATGATDGAASPPAGAPDTRSPPASQPALAPDAKAPASQAASQPSSQPTRPPATSPAAGK
ncbi:MAG: protein phosphatase 2C domain-containing protein [Deltaproteobacteria bacterium]|nr:protein phosphatase 2C domain-containing protein [Deltaproteobacteria bacterium]